jgi:hypothetical protein
MASQVLTWIFQSEVGPNHANPCGAGFQVCHIAPHRRFPNLRAGSLWWAARLEMLIVAAYFPET